MPQQMTLNAISTTYIRTIRRRTDLELPVSRWSVEIKPSTPDVSCTDRTSGAALLQRVSTRTGRSRHPFIRHAPPIGLRFRLMNLTRGPMAIDEARELLR